MELYITHNNVRRRVRAPFTIHIKRVDAEELAAVLLERVSYRPTSPPYHDDNTEYQILISGVPVSKNWEE